MTQDGYPDDTELSRIREWTHLDLPGAFAFIKSLWHAAEWGWSEEDAADPFRGPVRRYSISTGGWSGNEDLIGAMQDNFLLWNAAWVQSRRGGHYIFELPAKEPR